MTDRVGQQLGNYRLVRILGEGGFAEVYLGEHIHLGTPAAINDIAPAPSTTTSQPQQAPVKETALDDLAIQAALQRLWDKAGR